NTSPATPATPVERREARTETDAEHMSNGLRPEAPRIELDAYPFPLRCHSGRREALVRSLLGVAVESRSKKAHWRELPGWRRVSRVARTQAASFRISTMSAAARIGRGLERTPRSVIVCSAIASNCAGFTPTAESVVGRPSSRQSPFTASAAVAF